MKVTTPFRVPVSTIFRVKLTSAQMRISLVTLALVCASCALPPPSMAGSAKKGYQYDSSKVVPLLSTKGGIQVTDSAVAARLYHSEFLVNGGEADISTMAEYVDSIMCDTLAGMDAPGIVLEQYPLEYRLYRQRYYQALFSEFWKRNVDDIVSVDSADAIQLYHDSAHLFTVKEQVDAYHIFSAADGFLSGRDSGYYASLPKEELEQLAEDRIWMLWRILNFGDAFQNVAYQYSHDWRTKSKGGYIGWTVRGQYEDPFDTIAFNLPAKKYSRPYKDGSGWQIIMSDGHLPAGPVPIDSPSVYASARASALVVKSNIRGDSIFASLTEHMSVVPNAALLDTNYLLVDDSAWCGIVNGIDTIEGWRAKAFEEAYRKKNSVANTTPEMKKELLNEIGGFFAVVQAARRTKIDTLPNIKLSRARTYFYEQRQVVTKQAYDPGFEPDEKEIEAYYASAKEKFNPTRPYTFDVLNINDSAFGDFCWVQLQSGFEMKDLVKEYNGVDGHQLSIKRYDSVGQKQLEFVVLKAAEGTPRGKYSRPYTLKGVRQILRLIDAQESKSLQLAKPEIITELSRLHRNQVWHAYRDRLFKKYGVKRLVPLAGTIKLPPQWERIPDRDNKSAKKSD